MAVPMKTRIKSTDNELHYLAMCFLASYFALMKLSRVESVCGLRKLSGRLASYTALARLFPICCRDCNVVGERNDSLMWKCIINKVKLVLLVSN
jgi:hypothetical protein